MPGGHAFPSDYRWFMEHYGYGTVNDYLHVLALTPWSPRGKDTDPVDELLHWSQNIDSCAGERHAPDSCDITWHGTQLSFAADQPDGLLLCWGKDDGGNLHYWARNSGSPDEWPIMTYWRPTAAWFRFDGGFVEFLLSRMRETFPYPGEPINPDGEWEHVRARPVWSCEGDWTGPA